MGEAKQLLEKVKVENIIINLGNINYLENELVKIRKDIVKGYKGFRISCGKDNKFNHPNNSVLEILKDSKIYRTDYDGSVTFRFKKNKLEIDTS